MAIFKNILLLVVAVGLSSCTNNRDRNARSADLNFMTNYELSALSETCFKKGDYECAIKYLRPLSTRGNAKATYALGYIYFYGQGVAQNKSVGRSLIREAAAQGDTRAIEALKRITENDIPALQNT